jgi:hypothetical protein
VQVARVRHAQRLLKLHLPAGGAQQVGAAHDVGDACLGVIHHHGQLVGPDTIGAA